MALIVSSSSNKLQLQNLAVNINDLCIQKSVKLNVKLVPRVQNQIADSLGKSFDFDDWEQLMLSQYLSDILGTYSVNRLAGNFNEKVRTFNSKYSSQHLSSRCM